MSPLGLIAGEGVFPLLVARGARAAGRRVVCAGFTGSAWPELRSECHRFGWVGVMRISSWIRLLRRHGCREAIMVGRVAKSGMYDPWMYLRNLPDLRTLRILLTRLRHDKRPYAVLSAVADELAANGITLIDSTQYCAEHITTAGVLTRCQPTESQWIDIRAGWEVATAISRMDIGQAIAICNRDVIAVEALEGTNAMIERAGRLCPGRRWTLIKVANTRHDMRVDVPTVGVATIESVHAAGGACIVLEASKTLILEKPKVLELADRYGIPVVGHSGESGQLSVVSGQ